MKKLLIALTLGAALSASAQVPIQLENVTMKQNAWTRIVEVTYDLTGDTPDGVFITLDVTTNGVLIPPPVAVSGDITTETNLKIIAPGNTTKKIVWDAQKDWSGNVTTQAQAVVTAWFLNNPPENLPLTYAVVDLSGGPTASIYPVRYSVTPPNLSDDTCRTTELWLRRIPAGTFTMGSPSSEYGRAANEDVREVTLTQNFYIGVFQVTQRQWELVMGDKPSYFNNASDYAGRPVEQVSYNTIRGAVSDSPAVNWPATGSTVSSSSFMGKLRAKTGLRFDLPTCAQWEYAGRAGTSGAWNNNTTLPNPAPDTDPNLDLLGRYRYSGGYINSGADAPPQNCTTANGTAKVGSYQPNNWGLYDMHGNVSDWCLDWYADVLVSSMGGIDPQGPASSSYSYRIRRGGGYGHPAPICRIARCGFGLPTDEANSVGFRVCIQPQP